MERAMPRPPLLGRIPSAAWRTLTWGAATLYALIVYRGGPPHPAPVHRLPDVLSTLGDSAWGAVAVGLALPLGLAHRWPVPVLALTAAESLAAAVLGPEPWPLLMMATDALVLYVAATRRRRIAVPAALLTLALQLAEWRIMNGSWSFGAGRVAMPIGLAVAAAWLAGNSIRQRRDYGEALRVQAASQAVTAERLRIARELHDMIAHSIGVIAIQAGAAGLVIDTQPAGARKALGIIESTSRETLAGLRRMLVSLREAGGEAAQSAPAAGLEAVGRLVETAADAGVRVEVRHLGPPRPLPPEVDLAAFRIIQESVTNTVRHCGTGDCRVSVEFRDEELAVEITDDGSGAARAGASAGSGLGITGMRERVALLGGRFSAGPRPEGGFRVAARIPL